PGDDRLQVGERVLAVRLDDAAELRPVGELGAERVEELERQVLHVVVLHVEVDGRAGGSRTGEDRAETGQRLAESFSRREWAEERRERSRLHGDVDAGDGPP